MNATAAILPLAMRQTTPLSRKEQIWVENSADQLLACADVQFKRALHHPQGVTQEHFHIALDEFAMVRLGRKDASQSALGKLIHGVQIGNLSLAREGLSEVMDLEDSRQAMLEVAEGLLRPLARDGVIAEREDDES